MDVTPHLAMGAAIGARVRPPGAALLLALLSHFILDAIPHFHVAWVSGNASFDAGDVGSGLILAAMIAWRARHLWPLVTGLTALVPDAPGVRETWGQSVFGFLPHPVWPPPWGILTQIAVAGLAFLWGMKTAQPPGVRHRY